MDGTHWTGEVLAGRYRVEERLAVGGMGEVYRGTDLERGEPVAVKVPHAFLASDAAFAKRLLREAQTVAALDHPNIVRLFASGEHEGHPYLVMELVEGQSLAQRLRERGALAPARALGIVNGVLAALGHAHARGVVHRDVKPGNVLLGHDGTVKLVDFGIAHAQAQGAVTLTGTDELLGSLHYLAPERLAGQPATPAADLYGVGVMLYQMLTGQVPFAGDVPAVVAAQQWQRDPDPPSQLRAGLPPALDRLVLRALAKDPAQRYASAEAMLADLDRLTVGAHEADTARFAAPVAVGAAGAPSAGRRTAAAGTRGWLGSRLRALALAGVLFLAAAGAWYAFAVAQPDPPPDLPSVAAQPATETAAAPSPSATPTVLPTQTATRTPVPTVSQPTPTPQPTVATPTPVPPTVEAPAGVDQAKAQEALKKQAEQAKKAAEKRLEQLKKQQEKNDKKGRN